jgi:hypothetical protein
MNIQYTYICSIILNFQLTPLYDSYLLKNFSYIFFISLYLRRDGKRDGEDKNYLFSVLGRELRPKIWQEMLL